MLPLNKENLSDYKVWMYTSKDAFTAAQQAEIKELINAFVAQWESHGAPVVGTIELLHNRFIKITANNCASNLCGRAQDAQVSFIKDLENRLNLDLMNRMLIAFKTPSNEISVEALPKFKDYLKSIEKPNDLIVFDNTITSLVDFDTKWETTLGKTWLASVLN